MTPTCRGRRLDGAWSLVSLAALAFALGSGCSRSEAAPQPGAKPESASGVKGRAKVEAEQYSVEMKPAAGYKAGTEGTVEIAITAKGAYHINDKYPIKFKAVDPAPEGVTFPKPLLKREDGTFEAMKGSFNVPFVAARPGKAKISGLLSLSVCSEANCLMEKLDLEVEVDVR